MHIMVPLRPAAAGVGGLRLANSRASESHSYDFTKYYMDFASTEVALRVIQQVANMEPTELVRELDKGVDCIIWRPLFSAYAAWVVRTRWLEDAGLA